MTEIRTIKTDDCPSLSGRSTITCKIGHKGKEILLRLSDNSGGGGFGGGGHGYGLVGR